jgi:hypothetical protein
MLKKLLILAVCSLPAWSANTTLTRTVTGPDGLPASGTAFYKLTAPCMSGGSYVASETKIVRFIGAFSVSIVPNDTCIPAGTSYTVGWTIGNAITAETWVVPTSASPLDVSSVIVSIAPIPTPYPLLNLSQLNSVGAASGDDICFNGAIYAPCLAVHGPTGAQGATGAAGSAGAAGPTGAAGSNGSNGAAGATGTQGVAGPTGSAGTNGSAGATGSNGAAGATGPAGTTGSQGVAGPTGSAGSNGAAGATGSAGTNGSNGAAGATGSAGATGATGPTLFPVNAQTATYQALAADFTACKTISVASGTFTITLVASSSQPANGACIRIVSYSSGVVTIAVSGQNLNGGIASLTLPAASAIAPSGAWIVSDGTNYEATIWKTGIPTTATYAVGGGGCGTWTSATSGNPSPGVMAGTFVSGVSGTCQITVNFSTAAPHAWVCGRAGIDVTTGGVISQIAPLSTTDCLFSGATTSGDTVTWMAISQ